MFPNITVGYQSWNSQNAFLTSKQGRTWYEKQSDLGLPCMSTPFCRQLVFKILEHLLYIQNYMHKYTHGSNQLCANLHLGPTRWWPKFTHTSIFSALDLHRRSTSSMCEQSLCKIWIYSIKGTKSVWITDYTQINNISTPKVVISSTLPKLISNVHKI